MMQESAGGHMDKIKKKITVRFFSIDTSNDFFEDFVSSHQANLTVDKPVRIFNIRDKKHLIKIYAPLEQNEYKLFFLSIVRERTTWQAKALADGTISAIHLNQGILGDLFYYLVIPARKILLGFTAGPSASVRSVANTVLQQFKKDRTSKIALEPISEESEYTKLNDLAEFTEIRFCLAPSLLSDSSDDMPNIFRELKASPFMASSSKLELTVSEFGEGRFTHEDLLVTVDYLADNDCCTTLFIKGVDSGGQKIQLDFNKVYMTHNIYVQLRGNIVDEESAKAVILEALISKNILQ
ncbi:MAG: hypothetical protein LBK58_13855 [Prevotellaceae bacterium]|jgi:hypothetical protein|nr:hypothetical protein [Prevotellaceae bacterium]